MKKYIWTIPVAVLLLVGLVLGLCFCGNSDSPLLGLAAPKLSINDELIVSWEAVRGAERYIVNINGEDLSETSALFYPCFTASGTYTVKVRAVRGQTLSDYSNELTYTVYGVYVPDSEHCTVNGKNYVLPGTDYHFSLTLSRAAYASVPVVRVNGALTEPVDGVYTVPNVTQDLTVTVDGLVIANEYAVKLSSGEGYSLEGEKTAIEGLDYTFTLTLGSDYDRSKPIVKVNGEVLEPVDGVYTVVKPTGALTVTVEGVTKNVFYITIPTGSGFVASNAGKHALAPGEELRFTVHATGGTRALAVTVDGAALQPDEKTGEYILTADRDQTVRIYAYDVLTSLYAPEYWTSDGWQCTAGSITVTDNSVLSGSYLRQLWNAGYTHLIFTYTSKNTAGAFINGDDSSDSSWKRYWSDLGDKSGCELRIDINEFHTGSTWYDMKFLNMTQGNGFTLSGVRAFMSPETLQWKKEGVDASNLYFALEDGYYVLETHAAGQQVVSPTEWLQKYCVDDEVRQRTWFAFTDYLEAGSNYRSVLWGWGTPVNQLIEGTDGGWCVLSNMKTEGYTPGDVFSLTLEYPATARFKLSDTVSNRNGWNTGFAYTQLTDESFVFTTDLSGHKLRLASTNDYVSAGYQALKLTLSGDLNGNSISYGSGEDGLFVTVTEQELPAGGTYTAQVDLSALGGEVLQLCCQIVSGSISDMQVTVEPVGTATPPVTHKVTLPTGTGYTVSGSDSVISGRSYAFTATPANSADTLIVRVNGTELSGVNGVYTVDNVRQALVITVEVVAYVPPETPPETPSEQDAASALLASDSWSTGGTLSGSTLTVGSNAQLKADVLQRLWEDGYTHLVFTAKLDTAGACIHGGSEWDRYWRNLSAGEALDVRIDLNEFNENGTWCSLNFINMTGGHIAISDPRGYHSPETLKWTKVGDGKPSNVYFALEDGYYVLDTITGQGVVSPTEWLEKYCVKDDAAQRSWCVYTDYITVGRNTRSLLWGWGKAVNPIASSVLGGWSWLNNVQTDGYTAGEVFSLHTDIGGTARFKLLDWVSNRNEWNSALKLQYVDDRTVRWSASDSYKLRLATTQDLISAGVTALRVTLTGELGSAMIWYGDDDWSDGETGISANDFTGGSCTFEVDLTSFKSTESFTLMANGAAFKDLLVTVEPIDPNAPVQTYDVTAPQGEGFAFTGAETAQEGKTYTFTVTPTNSADTLIVRVNGTELGGTDGVYSVTNVRQALVITVEVVAYVPPELDAVSALLLASDSWSTGGTLSGSTLTVGSNAQLKADVLRQLWEAGYTHLVFTVNPKAASDNNTNFTHLGSWERYWRSIKPNQSTDLRIDLNEFHDGDTWYGISFNSGSMAVSNARAYSSPETLKWTKIGDGKPSNVYFAIEDGYYVLETITGQGVVSPTEWLKKYCVKDDAAQRSWRVYTDYITAGSNYRSMLWGWGTAVNNITGVSGGWTWLSNMQTDGYTAGETFSLHTDVGCTARFKVLDWVSNRNQWNSALELEHIDEQTVSWSGLADYKLRLATTQDLISAGATALKVTLTGELGSAMIWYGDDDWSDGETGISANDFSGGSCTFTVDLTAFAPTEDVTLMCSGAAFTDLQIHIEPVTG